MSISLFSVLTRDSNMMRRWMTAHAMRRCFVIVVMLFSAALNAQTEEETIDETVKLSDLKVDVTPLKPMSFHPIIEREVARILSLRHYKKFRLDDSLSAQMFTFYLESFDNNRSVFLASDIDEFSQYKYEFDNSLQKGDLSGAYDIFNRFKQRFSERLMELGTILQTEFDYTIPETYTFDRRNAPWLKTQEEMMQLWKRIIKNQALDLKLAGKSWEETRKTILGRYKNQARAVSQYKSEDVFQIYMNAFTRSIDPHTTYFSPASSDNFRINMSQSLEGIGAQLQTDNDYTKIAEVIAGGPAFKSKQLKKGDRIVAVAQGDTGRFIDVIGWRIDDVVSLIRGPKNTVVRLNIIAAEDPLSSTPKEIRLIRDKIKLENQTAKKDLREVKSGKKVYRLGIITIPTFYMDFEAYQRGDVNYNSTSRDVRRLVAELQSQKIDGLVIDLRNNGGGSLMEAIELSGLFIPQGPVVQVRDAMGKIEVSDDDDPSIWYSGPMTVLINRFSASASEIFAGAMQDYHRAIIIGENSFGKGTVQTLDDLNRRIQLRGERLGQLKFTTAKFYRITGSSTQHKGVTPDIEFPSAFPSEEFGEDAEPTALPWDEIRPAAYKVFGKVTPRAKSLLLDKHKTRIKKDDAFQALIEDVNQAKLERSKKSISLLESERKRERDEREARRLAKAKKIQVKAKAEQPNSTEPARDADAFLDEANNILVDMIILRIG